MKPQYAVYRICEADGVDGKVPYLDLVSLFQYEQDAYEFKNGRDVLSIVNLDDGSVLM